jgi:hypothetical protein
MVVTQDVRELAKDVGDVALEDLDKGDVVKTTTFVARLNPRTAAKVGETIQLVVDARHLHFFDIDTGLGIYEANAG